MGYNVVVKSVAFLGHSRKENRRMSKAGIFFTFLVIMMTLGTIATDYFLWAFFNQDIHWAGDCLIALVGGSITIPLGVVAWILVLFGVSAPFFG